MIKTSITSLFCISKIWKIAKIIPLKKLQKDDYINAKLFKPISLLQILHKVLESVIDQKLSFLVEDYGLLPDNHFQRQKPRFTINALIIFQEIFFYI